MTIEMLEAKVDELEARIRMLEAGTKQPQKLDLVKQWGRYVNKTDAANILGVTRATVYAMVKDERILAAKAGRAIDVQSIEDYFANPAKKRRQEHVD